MRKIPGKLFLLLTTFSIVIGLVGCSSTSSSDNGKDTIVIWTQASEDHPEGQMFAERVRQYNEAHPDMPQVEIENITRAGAGSGYIDKLNAAITAKDMPDIFTLDGPDVSAYVDAGLVGALDSYMSDGFKEGFTPAMIEQGTVDGTFYAMGYQDSGVVIMYNEDMINALPEEIKSFIPSSDEDWTWNEFIDLVKKVDGYAKTSDDPVFDDYEVAVSLLLTDITSGAYETGTYYLTPLLWSNGASIVAEDGVTVEGELNSDESIEALTEYARLFEEPALASASESEKAFHTGKTAFSVSGFWYINELTNNYPNLHFRTLRYPKMDSNYDGLYTPSGSWVFVRNGLEEDEEKIKQVVEIMEWLTNDEAAEQYYEANGAIPGRTASVDAIDTNTDNPYHNEAWTVLKYQVENTNKARPASPGYPYLSETFAKDILLKIAQNQVTDEETIKSYVDEAVKKIDLEFEKYRK